MAKKMRNLIGVMRSPYAMVGEVVHLNVNNPNVARYLKIRVLREVADTSLPADDSPADDSPAPDDDG